MKDSGGLFFIPLPHPFPLYTLLYIINTNFPIIILQSQKYSVLLPRNFKKSNMGNKSITEKEYDRRTMLATYLYDVSKLLISGVGIGGLSKK